MSLRVSDAFIYFTPADLKVGLLVSLLSVWVLVGVFYYLNQFTRRRYFGIWNVAWLFYALYLTLTLNLHLTHDLKHHAPDDWLMLMLKEWCISIAAVFLLWGSMRFLGQRVRTGLIICFMAFLLVWSTVANLPQSAGVLLTRRLEVQLPIFGLIGFSSMVSGWGFYQYRRKREYLGAGLLSAGFFLWGLYISGYPLLETKDEFVSTGFFISTVLQLFIAVAMIILVLEQLRFVNQRRAQRELQRKEREKAQLRTQIVSSEERYRKLFQEASEAILIAGRRDLSLLEVNQAAERMLGYDRDEVRQRTLKSFWPPGTVDDDKFGTSTAWCSELCRKRFHQLVRKDGGLVAVEVAGATIEFGGQAAYQVFLRELTERSRLEQQLRHAERLSSVGQMIMGVAHELNNPLTVVQGFLELVLARQELPSTAKSHLDKALQESHRAGRLVRNFLSLARDTGPRMTLDLNDLIRRVAELRKIELLRADIEILLDLQADLPTTCASVDQLQQVLIILLNNSMQALSGREGPGRIRIRTWQDDDRLKLLIEDNGPGVATHLQTKIFEPFFTTKPAGTGTGLGLSIAHTILVEHQGQIRYQTSSLGGAGFELDLPVVSGPDEAEPVAENHPEPFKTPHVAPRSAQILILDDQKPVADLLAEMVNLLGCQPVVCGGGPEALQLLNQRDFDLVFSDFHMPRMSGRQFYEAVAKQHPELAKRFVFLTGDVVFEESQTFLNSIGNPTLHKPFQMAALSQVITDRLGTPIESDEPTTSAT